MKRKLLASAGLLTAAMMAVVLATPAHAGPQLEIMLQSGAFTSISPIGVSPLVVVQSIGNFTTTVNTGTATDVPSLDLSSVDINASAGGTLIITLSANGFTTPISDVNWLSQFSGNFVTGTATVTLQTYLDNTNTLFGTATPLSTLTDSATPFGLSSVAAGSITQSPFALTEVLTIVTTGAAFLSLDASITDVPEPASMALFGVGMIGTGFVARRRRNRQALAAVSAA